MQNRAGLRHFLDSFGASTADTSLFSGNHSSAGIPQDSTLHEKSDMKPKVATKSSQFTSGMDSSGSAQMTETRLADLLDNTLWNRRLAPSSERIVYALVQQIFHGIKEYFLASAELKVGIKHKHLCIIRLKLDDHVPFHISKHPL